MGYALRLETLAQSQNRGGQVTSKFSKYVGMDTHKDTIAVAIAEGSGGKPQYYGEAEGEAISFCYEAGPCGYGIYRQITGLGQACEVVAPSLIPTKAGDRVKTDRRDGEALARLHRAGELTPVWVPDREQEAVRDLTRAREDMKAMERQARQRLNAFLLRHGPVHPAGKSKWTQAHGRWLERVKFENALQQLVFQEYVDSIQQAQARVAGLITAMTVIAELGDISRFDSPRQLMAYLGLVPSEYSSGRTTRRGGITKTGNGHVRRALVEAGWCCRFAARKSAHLERRAEKTSEGGVQAIAWKAQKRLCARYRHLLAKGKLKVQVCTAIARELAGFIWAIVCEVMGRPATVR